MLSAFFSYAVFVLLGYFKDISADRETDYRTLPVTIGWKRSLYVSAALGMIALIAAWALAFRAPPSSGPPAAVGWMLLATGSCAMWWAHRAVARTRSEKNAYKGIVWSVRAHVLLQLGLAALLHPPFAFPILALIPCFEFAMRLRPERTQV
jgi:4-hydroxybenzoate polyprenyltransferase